MKNLIVSFFLITAAVICADDFKTSIQAVKSGKSQTAMAHWWGFDSKDSTAAIQAAIDSKAPKIIVKKMDSPWIVRPIKLRSNQEIIFEPGVEIIAKEGAFKSISDCLFKAVQCKNLTLKGSDAKFIMRKKDYQNRRKYKKSEWRHGISLLSCENVLIKGITVKDSGGDGIYIGVVNSANNYCKNIKIENVICNGNNRQGISVISVEDLLIKDSRFINTDGTDPMAGIDFEPNRPNQRLVNCIVENCEISGNRNSGVTTYIKLDRKVAPPVSIEIRKCVIQNNRNGVSMTVPVGIYSVVNPVEGNIKFKDCSIGTSREATVQFKNYRGDGFKTVFENCFFKTRTALPIIEIIATPGLSCSMGNILLKNCKVNIRNKDQLLKYTSNYAPETKLSLISGTIINGNDKIDVAKYISQKKWDKSSGNNTATYKLSDLKVLKNGNSSNASKGEDGLDIRSSVAYLFVVDKKGKVNFDLYYRKIPGKKQSDMEVTLETPDGTKKALKKASDQINNYSFTAEKAGVFKITCDPHANIVNLKKASVPYSIALPEGDYLNLFAPKQPVYFDIPAGVSKIRLLASGQGTKETVDVIIKIKNKVIGKAEKILAPHLFDINIKPATVRRTGTILFNNAVEDVMIKILGPVLPIISVNDQELIIAEFQTAP